MSVAESSSKLTRLTRKKLAFAKSLRKLAAIADDNNFRLINGADVGNMLGCIAEEIEIKAKFKAEQEAAHV